MTRFTINGIYLAAVNVDDGGTLEGNWYTTISDRAEDDLPFGDYADWSEILTYGQHVQVVTSWARLILLCTANLAARYMTSARLAKEPDSTASGPRSTTPVH